MIKNSREDSVLLLLIIIIGTALRLVHFPDIPFTFDELSAVNRLSFNSFHDLIEKGIRNDGHPAGVQIFLYFWSRMFGTSEIAIKLPFIFCGIATIPLSYFIASKWFSKATGLFVSACIATLQFPVTYSDIARPYISGLFLSLLMVLCWTNYFFFEKRKLLNLFGFALCAALCAYNHYFSLLFAGIVGATGFFFLTKTNFKYYLIACAFALLLFSPHLKLFLFQYGTGGLLWLGKPKDDFLKEFVSYIFHYSPWLVALVLLLSLAGIAFGRDTLLSKNKFRIICIVWFLIPFCIGFYYSVNVKPVLQFSVLIFSFSYLLMFLFSFYSDKISFAFKAAIVAILLTANTLTLVFSREHYAVFFKEPVEQYALKAVEIAEDDSLAARTTIILQTDSNYLNYYFRKYKRKPEYHNLYNSELSPVEFKKLVSSISTDQLVTGGISLEYLNIVSESFPYEQYHQDGYGYTIYGFSKTPGNKKFPGGAVFESRFGDQSAKSKWTYVSDENFAEGGIIKIDSSIEYGPTFSSKLEDMVNMDNRHHIIDVSVSFLSNTIPRDGLLVFALKRDDEAFEWRSYAIADYFDKDEAGGWQNAYMPVRLADIITASCEMKNVEVSIFYWNKNKQNILLKDFKMGVREDNDFVYGLFGRLK